MVLFEINQRLKGHFLNELRVSFNISPPTHHFTELHNLLAFTDVKFDVIEITDSKLKGMFRPIFCIDINTNSDRK